MANSNRNSSPIPPQPTKRSRSSKPPLAANFADCAELQKKGVAPFSPPCTCPEETWEKRQTGRRSQEAWRGDETTPQQLSSACRHLRGAEMDRGKVAAAGRRRLPASSQGGPFRAPHLAHPAARPAREEQPPLPPPLPARGRGRRRKALTEASQAGKRRVRARGCV